MKHSLKLILLGAALLHHADAAPPSEKALGSYIAGIREKVRGIVLEPVTDQTQLFHVSLEEPLRHHKPPHGILLPLETRVLCRVRGKTATRLLATCHSAFRPGKQGFVPLARAYLSQTGDQAGVALSPAEDGKTLLSEKSSVWVKFDRPSALDPKPSS